MQQGLVGLVPLPERTQSFVSIKTKLEDFVIFACLKNMHMFQHIIKVI